jgi:hypothetical protein
LFRKLKEVAIETNRRYAERFGINRSTCITTTKPSGNGSQLFNSSSGMHPRHAPYYIRRVRIEATLHVEIGGEKIHIAADGNGPVSALDNALRKALIKHYPSIQKLNLVDYKVRVLDGSSGTGSKVRVLIETTDSKKIWGTVGVSANIIEASWDALLDSYEYYLLNS